MMPAEHPPVYVDPTTGRQQTDGFAKELSRRFNEGAPWRWQWSAALSGSDFLSARSTWPVTEPFAVRVQLPDWLNAQTVELRAELPNASPLVLSNSLARRSWHTMGRLPEGATEVRVHAALRAAPWNPLLNSPLPFPATPGILPPNIPGTTPPPGAPPQGSIIYEGTFTLPVRAVPTLAASMQAVSGAAFDERLRSALRVRVGWAAEGKPYRGGWILLALDRERLGAHSAIALPVTVEIMRNAEVLRSTTTSLGINDLAVAIRFDRRPVSFDAPMRRLLEEPGSKGGWTIRIRGELGEMDSVWQRETYWSGTLEFPLEDVLEGPWTFDVAAWTEWAPQPAAREGSTPP
jgi:hypothetical protein